MEQHEGLATAAYTARLTLAAVGAGGVVGSLAGFGGAGGGGLGGAAKLARAGGQLGAAAGVGVAIGTGVNYVIEGTVVADKIGASIAHVLAAAGNDEAQAAIDQTAKYDQMIAEQQQTKAKQEQMINEQAQTKQIQLQMSTQLGIMTAHLSNIAAKPVPTFNPTITINGRSNAMNMMDEVSKQSKRGKFGPYI